MPVIAGAFGSSRKRNGVSPRRTARLVGVRTSAPKRSASDRRCPATMSWRATERQVRGRQIGSDAKYAEPMMPVLPYLCPFPCPIEHRPDVRHRSVARYGRRLIGVFAPLPFRPRCSPVTDSHRNYRSLQSAYRRSTRVMAGAGSPYPHNQPSSASSLMLSKTLIVVACVGFREHLPQSHDVLHTVDHPGVPLPRHRGRLDRFPGSRTPCSSVNPDARRSERPACRYPYRTRSLRR